MTSPKCCSEGQEFCNGTDTNIEVKILSCEVKGTEF